MGRRRRYEEEGRQCAKTKKTIIPGRVFTTHFPGDGDQKDVWVISRYDTNRTIEFVRVSGLRSMIYRIELQGTQTGGTVVSWEQIITGLTEEGNRYVETLTQSDFTAMLAQMQEWLQNYLDTGEAVTLK